MSIEKVKEQFDSVELKSVRELSALIGQIIVNHGMNHTEENEVVSLIVKEIQNQRENEIKAYEERIRKLREGMAGMERQIRQ